MIGFERHRLGNGLKVVCHRDTYTPMVCVNVMYNVGSRDEEPSRTGFAHLFEHLMFGGSQNIRDYDRHVENAGGENNAFTTSDITNYYLTLPAGALETAFWLESDRMLGLGLTENGLKVQKDVVLEEFNQRYLNQPYGDAWLILRPLAYKVHPYRWPTIGSDPEHIRQSSLEEVRAFYHRHYHPSNAVLSVAGNVDPDRVFELAEKWFGSIPARERPDRKLPEEPAQTSPREESISRDVPATAFFRAYRSPRRMDASFPATDLLSDIMGAGNSSRLYRKLVKQKAMFSELTAYVTGDLDPGLFVIAGKLADQHVIEEALREVDAEVSQLQEELIAHRELEKVKNKFESVMAFGELSISEKALNLAYYELSGDAGEYNELRRKYLDVSQQDIHLAAQKILTGATSSTLVMHRKNGA